MVWGLAPEPAQDLTHRATISEAKTSPVSLAQQARLHFIISCTFSSSFCFVSRLCISMSCCVCIISINYIFLISGSPFMCYPFSSLLKFRRVVHNLYLAGPAMLLGLPYTEQA